MKFMPPSFMKRYTEHTDGPVGILTTVTDRHMKKLLGFTALAALAALPAASFAATYAYVNTSNEVTTVEAADANTALRTAPNIAVHSGVMLLTDPNDDIVGNSI
jgi:hypothetical protein